MLFTLSSLLVPLAVSVSTMGFPTRGPGDATTCEFVFTPTGGVSVDPATTNVIADFNFITGFELASVSGVTVFNTGATFIENPDDVFNVENTLSADGLTAAESAAILEGLAGQTRGGPSGITWAIESADCDA